ncbi:MAG: sigma-54 dependent transcriptional regulator [Planctomycetaceae bacterium]
MPVPTIATLGLSPLLVRDLPAESAGRCRFENVPSLDALREHLRTAEPAALVLDLSHVTGGGHVEDRFLETLRARHPTLAIVMLTAAECPEPLERRAACDRLVHLREPLEAAAIAAAIARELELDEPPEVVATPASAFDERDRSQGGAVLRGITRQFETHSLQLKKMLEQLEVAARHDVTILLIGETGSGKTFLSKLIHEVSPRRDEPFLPVACGALPNELIESELFGHMKGAFTSAHADKEGKFIAAGKGTVLLDEIDVIGTEQQVKLLRVIETGEFEAVGSNTTLKSRARLVVASNLALQPLVEQGRFRPDLYYRLNMLKFEIPPLRARKADIQPLAKKFIRQLAERHHVEITQVSEELYDALLNYPWPGNVRELENVIQRAVIYSRDGVLSVEELPEHIVAGIAGPTNDPSVRLSGRRVDPASLGAQIAMTEQEIIEQALFKNSFSKTRTARELGISRVTLYNKLKKYGMK